MSCNPLRPCRTPQEIPDLLDRVVACCISEGVLHLFTDVSVHRAFVLSHTYSGSHFLNDVMVHDAERKLDPSDL